MTPNELPAQQDVEVRHSPQAVVKAALCERPRTLPDLCAASGLSARATSEALRALVEAGDVRCSRLGNPGERRDADRLLWHVVGRPALLRSEATPPSRGDVRREQRLRAGAKAHSSDRPEPIEILARMAGRTNFRTPKTPGAMAVPVTPLDIAHAIATVPDKLGAAMAMAMACQRSAEWPLVEELGLPQLLAHIRRQRVHPGIVDGANVFRARIALWDAFHDLVAPAQTRPLNLAARGARMRRQQYRWLLNEAAAFLEAAANTAAADAVRFLFALAVLDYPLAGSVRAVSVASTGEILIWTSVAMGRADGDGAGVAVDLEALCEEVLRARGRSPGILSLPVAT